MINNLLRDNKLRKFILLDCETESVRLFGKNRSWQISYLLAEGLQVKEVRDYYLYWPDLDVSEGAAKVTGFDKAKYEKLAKDPRPILEELDSYLYNPEYLILGHNICGFDSYILKNNKIDLGLKHNWSYLDRTIDTMCLAKMVKLGISECRLNNLKQEMFKFSDFVQKNLKTSIITLLKEYEIPFEEEKLHDSKYDIQYNFEIFKKLVYKIDI